MRTATNPQTRHGEPMTDREREIRGAAIRASHGEPSECSEPNEPTQIERYYLQARESFKLGKQCAGWDALEMGDDLAGEPQRNPEVT